MRNSILALLVVGVAALFNMPTDANARSALFYLSKTPAGSGTTKPTDPLFTLKPLVTKTTLATAAYKTKRAARIKELVKSIAAIEDPNHSKARTYYRYRMTAKRREKIADAALYAEEKTGVEAVFMLAVARMESDFRELILLNNQCKRTRSGYCWADCGMTQHHVRGPYKYVMRKCKKLAKDFRYSFLNSAQEFARHITWCQDPKRGKRYKPIRRCILNRYNMGPMYKTRYKCIRSYYCHKYVRPPDYLMWPKFYIRLASCWRVQRKCIARAAYWKKLTCFEYGARHKIRSKRSCRRCYSLTKISTRFYPALPTTAPKVMVAAPTKTPARKAPAPITPAKISPKAVVKSTHEPTSSTPPHGHPGQPN